MRLLAGYSQKITRVIIPDSKVRGANMTQVGPMLAP